MKALLLKIRQHFVEAHYKAQQQTEMCGSRPCAEGRAAMASLDELIQEIDECLDERVRLDDDREESND